MGASIPGGSTASAEYKMIFSWRKKKVKKQEALFTEALNEAGYEINPAWISIDHPTASCAYKDKRYPVIFPLRFLREARQLHYEKKIDFCFRGLQTPKRDWVKDFGGVNSQISFTDHGRKINKDLFDREYYQEMASSKFTLCPAGDFKWTYRFLEAIMCHSIPIIEEGADYPQCEGFIYFTTSKDARFILGQWDETILKHNYQLFLKRHTLLNNFIFID